MASSKSLKKFCNLSKYIKQNAPRLYDVFEDLCLLNYLRPARGANGITFLFPKEKAYRDKIIKEAYGPHPEVAVNMLRALILQDYYPSATSFNGNVVNLLNQKLDITESSDKLVKLKSGLELTKDAKFEILGYRDNMAVYTLSGKGEVPLNGTAVVMEKKVQKTGGSAGSSKTCVQGLLRDTYSSEVGKYNNIYVKKVYLQLKFIEKCAGDISADIMEYLGNDEFTDSYLLDMYCEAKQPKCFEYLVKGLSADHEAHLINITVDKYRALKNSIVAKYGSTTNSIDARTRMENISSPMEIRERVLKLYNNDKKRIGKDLFIIFGNVCKDMWMTSLDKVELYQVFEYLASKIYTCCTDILNHAFDAARDLTLYGNLLKSDVLMFNPANTSNLPIPEYMPSPLDMNLFSMSGYIAKLTVQPTTGGGEDKCLDDMFEGL